MWRKQDGLHHQDHDRAKFERRKELFSQAAGFLNQKYGSGTVEAAVKDSYYNMKEKIEPHMDLIDKAKAVHGEAGYPGQSWFRSGEARMEPDCHIWGCPVRTCAQEA